MINPGPSGAAPFGVTHVCQDDFNTHLSGADCSANAGQTASDHKDIGHYFVDLAIVDGIGPFREFPFPLNILMPYTHYLSSRVRDTKTKSKSTLTNIHGVNTKGNRFLSQAAMLF
jgi:hypothetical protein